MLKYSESYGIKVRRLGYALDVATLQQIAYKNGITQSINTMTQAQKSQLRYVAIMEQSKNALGDMGRTLNKYWRAIQRWIVENRAKSVKSKLRIIAA